MKKSIVILAITIPVLAIITGLIIIPAFVDSDQNKDCNSQEIIINDTDHSIFISCLPAMGGKVLGNITTEHVT